MQDIGDYTIEAELHQGQSNVVYRARSRTSGERVVLKLLRNEFPTVNEIARFEREFRVASNLKLKHTVRIKELIRFGHRPVIVYLDDGAISLRRYFGGRALDIGTLLDVCLGAASAVAELHRERLVHHDINPAISRDQTNGLGAGARALSR
jgi:histidine kinase